ncbi:AP2 domain-containing protein [Clostridium botulinum]|nr:AP2 domain-containing protein [Clostridium botulinum]
MKGGTLHKKGTRNESYMAEMRINGERYKKSFSTSKYGFNYSFDLASKFRFYLEQISNDANKDFLNRDDMEKLFILKDICDFYNYTLEISDKIYYYYDGSKEDKEYSFEATTVKEALNQWLETLEETDKCNCNEGVSPIWTAERYFICNL